MSLNLRRAAPVVAALVTLAACTETLPDQTGPGTTPSAVLDERPSSGQIAAQPINPPPPAKRPDEIIRGTGSFVAKPAPVHSVSVTGDGETTLNFVNADVSEVAKAVLGDYLKLNYVVDANVQGAVTLQTSHPLPRAAVLPALEEAFRLSGLGLVQTGDTYRIVPLAEAARQSGVVQAGTGTNQPGFGVEIVPLHYVGAAEMQHMLEPLVPTGSVLRADTARNLLVIAGTAQDRRAIIENVEIFDVDWMQGMSFAVFPLRSADAKTVAAELSQIIGTKNGPLSGVVELTAIERMNAILAVSPQVKYLDTLRGWVDRLDKAQESSDQRLFVYYVQNGRASDLAGVLGKALGVAGSESGGSGSAPSKGPQGSAVATPVFSGGGGGGGQSAPRPPTVPTASDGDALSQSQGSQKSGIRITADETSNALLVLATPAEYDLVSSALAKLDLPPLQVLLEASVAEVTLTDALNFGLQFYFQAGSQNQFFRTSGTSPTLAPQLPGFNYILSSGKNINAVLSALDVVTKVNVLSAPNVLVLNNQTATLEVGDQVPITTQSAVGVTAGQAPIVNSVEYRDTGIILKVTPRANESGLVMMDVSQEVSQVSSTTSSSIDSPTISERKINSTIAVQDGETIALGGLISDSRSKGKSGIPYLQDVPYIGNLFTDVSDSTTRTELLVLITPHLIQGVQKLRSVTEELKRKMPATLPVFNPPPLPQRP